MDCSFCLVRELMDHFFHFLLHIPSFCERDEIISIINTAAIKNCIPGELNDGVGHIHKKLSHTRFVIVLQIYRICKR